MRLFLSILSLPLACEGAVVTFPSNPNYYKYAPDENANFNVKSKADKKLDEKIQRKLQKWFISSYDGQIKIDVKDGNVTLNGFVGNKWDKDEIENKVKSIEGIRSINNQITIQGSSNW